MRPKKQFNSQSLRSLLIALLVLIVIGGAGVFYWSVGQVREYAVEVEHRIIDAEASRQQINQLQNLRAEMAQNSSLIEKAGLLFATPETYRTKAQNDITTYASAAGLSIKETTFADPADGAYTITVKFNNPVSFNGLITFLNNIEGNLPKMQVRSITLSNSTSAANVNVNEMTIGILVR
jgi:type II secretory pathway component PulM